MSKTPEEMARKFANEAWGEQQWRAYCGFLAGYEAARAVVEEELKLVQARREETPGLGPVCYVLNNILEKM